jgi:hypothetical protein
MRTTPRAFMGAEAETAAKRCALQDAAGRVETCPGAGCPFWEEGGAVVEAGCAIERLAVNLSNPQLAQQLLELRAELDVARRGGVRAARSLFELVGRDGDL